MIILSYLKYEKKICKYNDIDEYAFRGCIIRMRKK